MGLIAIFLLALGFLGLGRAQSAGDASHVYGQDATGINFGSNLINKPGQPPGPYPRHRCGLESTTVSTFGSYLLKHTLLPHHLGTPSLWISWARSM